MAHCVYRDSHGVAWQVWDVTPKSAERRKARFVESALRKAPERRVRSEVRMAACGASDRWLVFESSNEKRRLKPVPHDWQLASPIELESMCARAAPAQRPSQRLIE
jgi:hypothetical protein